MSRVISFGCSHTFGMGLPDVYLGIEKNFEVAQHPSAYAWPQLIANNLNLECINKGICAASNLQILNEIVSFDFQPLDKVYVLWTTPYRDWLKFENYNLKIGSFLIDKTFNKAELYNLIIPGVIDKSLDPATIVKIAQKYFSVHDLADMEFRSWLHQFTTGMFLESKNINFVFSTGWAWNQNTTPFKSYIKSLNVLNQIKDLDYALDGRHFGPKTHGQMANLLIGL